VAQEASGEIRLPDRAEHLLKSPAGASPPDLEEVNNRDGRIPDMLAASYPAAG
jgi:hypothetical protein